MPPLNSVIVTGVASGIGAAAAKILKAAGVTVIGLDSKPPEKACVDQYIPYDQGSFSSIDKAANALSGRHDGLLNIAGVPPSAANAPSKILMVNFYGLRYLTEQLYEKLNDNAAIVNLSSAAGMGWMQNIPLLQEAIKLRDAESVTNFCELHSIHNNGMANDAAYSLSKQLLIVWTAHAFNTWKQHKVRMNGVAPAAVNTPILDDFLTNFGAETAERLKTIGVATAEEIAEIAVMLLDPAYARINGATIPAEMGAITFKGLSEHFG